MATKEETLRKKLEEIYLKEKGGKTTATPSTPPPPKPAMFNKPADMVDSIEFEDITGEPHEDGNKHLWPASIMHKDSDWPEEMQVNIPVKTYNHVPDHAYVCDLLDALSYNKTLMAKGDPGSGKDSTIEWLCGILRLPYVREDGAEGKEPSDMLGYCVPDGNGGFSESEGLLTKFAKYGGVYVSSEPFVNPASVNMVYQSLLESSRILKWIGHPDPMKAQFKAHKDFRIMFTSNSRGTGDDVGMYAAVTVQDQSTLNRIDIHTGVSYLPTDKEIAMLKKLHPDITDVFASKMVQLANSIRQAWKSGIDGDSLGLPFSPRQLDTWAETSIRECDPVRGFKKCYYNALDDDEKGFVKRLWNDVDFDVPLN